MNKKDKNHPKCPYCKTNDEVVQYNKKLSQFRCKKCDKYFSPNTTRSRYNKETNIVLKTLSSLIYSKTAGLQTLKDYAKSIINAQNSTIQNTDVKFCFETNKNLRQNRKYNINGDLRDCVLMMKTKDGFEIIKNLDECESINFENGELLLSTRKYQKPETYHIDGLEYIKQQQEQEKRIAEEEKTRREKEANRRRESNLLYRRCNIKVDWKHYY